MRTSGAISEHLVLRGIRARRHAIQSCVDLQPWSIRAHPHVLFLDVGTGGVASIPTFHSRALHVDQESTETREDLVRSELAVRCIVGALDGLRFASSEKSRSAFEITVASKAGPARSSGE
jgi:hypothetical protein